MIVNRYGAFGSPSIAAPGVDCPAGGDWTQWCACVFGLGSPYYAKCITQPFPFGLAAPWTVAGAGARGIPHVGTLSIDTEQHGDDGVVRRDDTVLGLPSTVALLGGLTLAAGGLALFAKRRKR